MKTIRFDSLGLLTVLVAAAASTTPAAAQSRSSPSSLANKLHANAVESFRAGRFPEAYGRFIALAEAGHPASARYAIWMCQNGPELFGKDWDCAPHEIEDWARVAGVTAPTIGPRHYAAKAATAATAGPRPTARR